MKSIYSLPVLQGILDHFGVGRITYTTYFDAIGREVWRHSIETTRGDYELYSYPVNSEKYAQERIAISPGGNRGILFSQACHSFDRYHSLKQFAKKILIPKHQLEIDVLPLVGTTITKSFRVYGSIVQMKLSDQVSICSYGYWNVQHTVPGDDAVVVVDSEQNTHDEMDALWESLPEKNLKFESMILKDDWFELYFSDGYSFHFQASSRFAAAQFLFLHKEKIIDIFSEKYLYYLKEF